MKKMLIALAATAVLGMGTAMAENCIGAAAIAGGAALGMSGGNVGFGAVAAVGTYVGCEIKNSSNSNSNNSYSNDNSGWE